MVVIVNSRCCHPWLFIAGPGSCCNLLVVILSWSLQSRWSSYMFCLVILQVVCLWLRCCRRNWALSQICVDAETVFSHGVGRAGWEWGEVVEGFAECKELLVRLSRLRRFWFDGDFLRVKAKASLIGQWEWKTDVLFWVLTIEKVEIWIDQS